MSPTTYRTLRLLLGVPVVVFFATLAVMAFLTGRELNRAAEATLRWSTAAAEIESVSIDPLDMEKPPSVYYRFTADGRQFSSMRIYPEGAPLEGTIKSPDELRSLFRAGTKLPVHFDPFHPSRCALLLARPTWVRQSFLLALLAAVASVAVALRLITGYAVSTAN